MTTKTKRRPSKARPVRPVQRPSARHGGSPRRWSLVAAAAVLLLGALALGLVRLQSGGGGSATAAGLPNTPDYHSLLVEPGGSKGLLLGTHNGLYRSSDGGRTWRPDALRGEDAMNLVRPGRSAVWVAGHEVLAQSRDGGRTWSPARPSGLPGLDVHGFAADPRDPQTLYAAIAGTGLYRSRDGGGSFRLLSSRVGPDVMALAVAPDGRILAGDMQRGLMVSRDGGGTWSRQLAVQVMGIAINPKRPSYVLATGPGILLSRDGGRRWHRVAAIAAGAGPVAWSTADPNVAYAVGFDRTLYRSADRGSTWEGVR
jgi:photosystem II stability/assembly factor-like uncharacterized protein